MSGTGRHPKHRRGGSRRHRPSRHHHVRQATTTGFYVDVPLDTTTAGVQMQLFTCNDTTAQHWLAGFPEPLQ
ncbi:MAG TPA: hypothetical protein VGM10_27820 [Actinocrinis sp.]